MAPSLRRVNNTCITIFMRIPGSRATIRSLGLDLGILGLLAFLQDPLTREQERVGSDCPMSGASV